MAFFFGLFFFVRVLFGRRTRAAKEDFCGVDLFILFIYFFIVLSPQITQKEKRARTNLSHFTRGDDDDDARFFTRERMLIEDGGESLVTSSEEEEEEEEVEIER